MLLLWTIRLLIIFFLVLLVGTFWVYGLRPILFKESLNETLEDAAEQRMVEEARKKAGEILKSNFEQEDSN